MAVMRLHFFHPDHMLFDVANKVRTSRTFQKRTHVACRDENQSPTNSIMFEKNPLLLQMGQQLK
jgi:hypothetical protein